MNGLAAHTNKPTYSIGPTSVKVSKKATKACHYCRHRKIRCDVTHIDIPCRHCMLAKRECTVAESKRKSKFRGNELQISLPSGLAVSQAEMSGQMPSATVNRFLPDYTLSRCSADSNIDHGVPTTFCFNSAVPQSPHGRSCEDNDNYGSNQNFLPQTQEKQLLSSIDCPGLEDVLPSWDISALSHFLLPSENCESEKFGLPRFIQPLPSCMGNDDVEYMCKKGAFEIPPPMFRNRLLRSYILWIHPFVPIIDLYQLSSAMLNGNGDCQISLLLFHAVMFAGSAYVELKVLTSAGYSSRRDARKDFFQRAKLLYDMDAESNHFSVAQALILMSYWYESPTEQKDTWYWASLALSSARAIGFDLSTDVGMDASAASERITDMQRHRQWRVIFWSAYCRYTITALGMRQPLDKSNLELDIPMLALNDFSLKPLPLDLLVTMGYDDCLFLHDVSYHEQMAHFCIAQTELCVHLARIIECQYSVANLQMGSTAKTTTTLSPSTSPAEIVSTHDQALTSWLSNLPKCIQYRPLSFAEDNGRMLFVHRAFLKLLYLTVSVTLHRPHAQQSYPSLPSTASEYCSYRRMEQGATEILEIANSLQCQGLTRFLPLTAVTVILTAAIFNLQRTESEDIRIRVHSGAHLHTSTLVMASLKEVHVAADVGLSVLAGTIRGANFQWCHQYLCALGSVIAS